MLAPSYDSKNLLLATACESAFVYWLKQKWMSFTRRETELDINIVPSIEDLKSAKHQSGSPTFPYCLIATAGFQLNTDWGGYARRFQALTIGKDMQNKVGRVARLTPVRLGYGLQFRTDDRNDVLDFVTLLYSTAPGPHLYLQMPDTGFMFGFRTTYPPDVDAPFSSEEDGKYHKMDLSLVMNSWMGQYTDVGLIKSVYIRTYADVPPEGKLQYDPDTNKWYPQPISEQEKTEATSFQSNSWTFTSRGDAP